MNYFLKELLEKTKGNVTLNVNGDIKKFEDGEKALKFLNGYYEVLYICGNSEGVCIDLKVQDKKTSDWAEVYKDKTGEEVSFF